MPTQAPPLASGSRLDPIRRLHVRSAENSILRYIKIPVNCYRAQAALNVNLMPIAPLRCSFELELGLAQ
jgi:hypothetical protein